MAFVKFSSEYAENSKTQIDNIFFNDYLPYAPSDFVKVYIFAVYMSGIGENPDNNIENFCKILDISEFELMSALQYWQNEGLIQMYDDPVKVVLMPLKDAIKSEHKWKKSKFEEFNLIVQDLKQGAMISTNEYNAYYEAMEKYHIDIPSMIMIIKFCIEFKNGENVGYKYILSVVNSWAEQGIITQEKIQQQINDFNSGCDATIEILKALGSKKKPSFEERNLYEKWIKDYGFNDETLKFVAKNIKYNKTFYKLDAVLTKYYELKLLSKKEIEDFENQKNDLQNIAKDINKRIGVYYENLDNVIEKYILPWQNLGYDNETLTTIADYCFKNSIRTLEGMNSVLQKFYKNGVVTGVSLNQYMENSIKTDTEIKNILNICGLIRNVNSWDRDFWRTWTYTWNLPSDLIEYGAGLSNGKTQPMQYLNKLLSTWKEQNIKTVEEASKTVLSTTATVKPSDKPKKNIITREYTKEELDSAFSSLDDLW